jgi:hypothetical protein
LDIESQTNYKGGVNIADIIDSDMRKKAKDILDATIMIPDKDIMEQIYTDPMAILKDDKFILKHIIDNGYHCSCLVEALGLEELLIKIKGTEYKLFYQKPNQHFTHQDVMFETDKFKEYAGKADKAMKKADKEGQKELQKIQPDKIPKI